MRHNRLTGVLFLERLRKYGKNGHPISGKEPRHKVRTPILAQNNRPKDSKSEALAACQSIPHPADFLTKKCREEETSSWHFPYGDLG